MLGEQNPLCDGHAFLRRVLLSFTPGLALLRGRDGVSLNTVTLTVSLAAAAILAVACGPSGDYSPPPLPPGMLPPPVTNADGLPPAVPFDPSTPRVVARAIASWPHDTAAYTQGLFLQGSRVIESTGLEGQSDLRDVDMKTGRVVSHHRLPVKEFGEGIAQVDNRIFQITWQGGRGHVYDAKSLAPVDSFSYSGEGWGLASDGKKLYMSDGTASIRIIDPSGFTQQSTIAVAEAGKPVPMLNELEWINGELWANIYQTSLIARISPASGQVLGWVDLGKLLTAQEQALVSARGGTANGIAYDSARKRILVTGKLWPRLFEIALPSS